MNKQLQYVLLIKDCIEILPQSIFIFFPETINFPADEQWSYSGLGAEPLLLTLPSSTKRALMQAIKEKDPNYLTTQNSKSIYLDFYVK